MSQGPEASRRPSAPSATQRLRLLEAAEKVAKLGSWEWLPQFDVLFWSDNLHRIFGLEPGEVAPTLDLVLDQTHPDDRERVGKYVEAARAEANLPPIEFRIQRDGCEVRYLRATITVVETDADGATHVVGAVQDVTEEHHTAHEIAAHVAVTRAVTDWDSAEESVRNLLAGLGRAVEAVFAAFWLPRGDDRLAVEATWYEPALALEEFESATMTLRVTPHMWELPALAWRSRRPEPVADVSKERWFTRRKAAARGGLRGAVAFPVLHGGEVLAVVELFGRDRTEPSGPYEQTLMTIGAELGEFLSRHRGQLGGRRLTARQLAVLQLAADGRTTAQIAAELGLRASTVRTHFDHVYAKLGVAARGQAIAQGVRLGLIR